MVYNSMEMDYLLSLLKAVFVRLNRTGVTKKGTPFA